MEKEGCACLAIFFLSTLEAQGRVCWLVYACVAIDDIGLVRKKTR